jgi:hypoxanthine phosphoribosyltransferase
MPVAEFPDADELISAARIAAGFDQLAARLQPLISQGDCVLLGVLNGGMFPLVHIAERLNGDFLIDYCHATRYRGAIEGAALEWRAEPHFELAGRTVIIVDDIFDEGSTLQAIARYCHDAGAARVVTAVMVIKERNRDPGMPWPDFDTGLRVPDVYVFGCGMDLYERWRHVPAIYGLRAGVTGQEEG